MPAAYWEDHPEILAGRDMEAGGTWMGINTKGEISMLTNYRDPFNIKSNSPSRGHLVSGFLKNNENAHDYLQKIAREGHLYNGFNMICGNVDQLYYYGNYSKGVHEIALGFHGLSNALLNTSWPKVDKGLEKLKSAIKGEEVQVESLFKTLYDDVKAPPHLLPDTGIGAEKEQVLSSIFIKSPGYGSRCSTVLLVDNENQIQYVERTYDPADFSYTDRTYFVNLNKLA
ncbi:hypothetical protein C900_01861 [Fulvivirga imtechensis AK7]|uniref:NRDE family protein n=2 Tax=Fulvivirga TaxID=396811 RepID=L8JWW1_9BACT|nr:hypothetical protein C900_01861 [Fulvivirga imtechensis AK7]